METKWCVKNSHFILALQVNVHPAQLALEALSGVPLHDLGADVTGGDVLVAVLCELVRSLQHWRRSHCCWWLHTSRPYWCLPSSSLHVLEGVHPLTLELACHLLTTAHSGEERDRDRGLVLPRSSRRDCYQIVSLLPLRVVV